MFNTVNRKRQRNYDVSRYKSNNDQNQIKNVVIYSKKEMYSSKTKKDISYSSEIFDVEGEAYVKNGIINVIINKQGYDKISSMNDIELMYDQQEDALIHEITHYWDTESPSTSKISEE